MTMIPTATGYDLLVKIRPAHRALTSAKTALANFETRAGIRPQPDPGAHWAPLTGAAAWLAEETAQEYEIFRVSR